MKKFLLMVLLIFILYYIGIGFLGKEKEIPLKIKKLYLNFTPTMKDLVSYKLSLINCFPEDYYYENSAICFKCEIDACFEYKWVDRGIEGNKMSLVSSSLKFKEFNVKVADFYSNGLASLLNCREKDEKSLECDYGVRISLNSIVKVFAEKDMLNNIANVVCKDYVVSCEEYVCSCDNIILRIGKVTGELYYGFS